MRVTGLLAFAVLALAGQVWPQQRALGAQCKAVSSTVKLDAGKNFAQEVGGLKFRIRATHDKALCNGWRFSLEDAAGNDFIYPVNLPLRFNPSQFLACSYGLTARQGLEMKREMRFILSEKDYLRLDPLMRDALWPAGSPDSKHDGDKYLEAVGALHTGLVRLNTLHFELSPNGLIRSATFRVEIIVPDSFYLDSLPKSYPTVCPAMPEQ
jgi:hypothetical protein